MAAAAPRAVPPARGAEQTLALSAELQSAATVLYRENVAFVWRNARRLGCSDEWVDDAVHEIFLVATRRLAEFEHRSIERTWLFAITYRVVQRMLRDRGRQRQHVERFVRELPPAVGDASHEAEAAQYLRYLIGLLPKAQQLVLILAELEGFTTAEIAETLGIPPGTVHSRVRAAKLHLTEIIERERERDERPEP